MAFKEGDKKLVEADVFDEAEGLDKKKHKTKMQSLIDRIKIKLKTNSMHHSFKGKSKLRTRKNSTKNNIWDDMQFQQRN